ncbi:Glucan endo-1,3-beta-D-glucosidase [Bertholletia excelsa]
MVPNQAINDVASNQTLADVWIETNVIPFYPTARIRYIYVGNEILSYYNGNRSWPYLVPAMNQIDRALKTRNIRSIKVSTTLGMDVLIDEDVFPPSKARFRPDISMSVMKPMLRFLSRTKSYYSVNLYPYFVWSRSPNNVSLDYALFTGKKKNPYKDSISGLVYTNLLDQMLDSLIFAMKKLDFDNVPLYIAETGWPNAGDIDQIGANIFNAATYNRNLVRKVTAIPPAGTPARPGEVIPTDIFALYNENQKGGPGTERHWGLLYPNGSHVYEIDLSGRTRLSEYRMPLPAPENNEKYKGKIWCVVAGGVNNQTALEAAMKSACARGKGTCRAIRPGGRCSEPASLIRRASYAFSSYWARFRKEGEFCFFNGLAVQTTQNPSKSNYSDRL